MLPYSQSSRRYFPVIGARGLSLAVLWLPPLYSLRIQRVEDASGLMVFVAIGFAISFLNEARLQAERRATAAEEQMRREQESRTRPSSL